MKTFASLVFLAAGLLIASAAPAASSDDRTSMPSNCSERDVNCVINDGPPRRRRGSDAPPEKDKRGNTPPGQDRSGAGPAAGTIADPSGATRK